MYLQTDIMILQRNRCCYANAAVQSLYIVTRYGLHGPMDQIPVGANFARSFRTALGPTLLLVHYVPSLIPGGKAPGAWR